MVKAAGRHFWTENAVEIGLSLGNFDGVHRGHQALLHRLAEFRRRKGGNARLGVLSFEPHPVEFLRPGTFVPRLSPENEKRDLIRRFGIDDLHVLKFDPTLAQMSAKDFFDQVLIAGFRPTFLVVGQNFFFGHGRGGSPGNILDWSRQIGIEAEVQSPIEADGDVVSSTRIRKLLAEGQTVAASRLLGRDYALTGAVVAGDRRGRQLGFPTANLNLPTLGVGQRCFPKRGVYLTASTTGDGTFPSITNVGVKPTVSDLQNLVVETHILDFSSDIYGKTLRVEFRDRLRDEKRFSSIDELKAQIAIDVATARTRIGRI